jgi:hypothetical protein
MDANKRFTDVMVDVETTGLRADRHAMIQLAAVPFNLATGEVCQEHYFDKCLRVPAARGWQEGTRSWWYGKNEVVLHGILARMEDPRTVMDHFKIYCEGFLAPDCRFWQKRPFDWQWVESYFNDYEIQNPFRYQNVIEMTAFMKGMAFPDEMTEGLSFPDYRTFLPHIEGKDEFDAHNAYFDCLVQINKVIGLGRYYGAIPHGE